ncbi:hypothetical protein JKP88DRAFT_252988 [Tribonema minus]|uniref:Uncharacterized protein n=1 Tax=Tribonema minus TaxID=303371 RepID=A0A835Z8R1_9STRA|nr:hypothetical protein JKP88DRAFT_252988 [Tribonema minus]
MFLGSAAAVGTVLLAAVLGLVIPSIQTRMLVVAAIVGAMACITFYGWVAQVTETTGSTAASTSDTSDDARQMGHFSFMTSAASSPKGSCADARSRIACEVGQLEVASGAQTRGQWTDATRRLIRCSPFWWLLASHFAVWAVTIFTKSTLPAFVHEYLEYSSFGSTSLHGTDESSASGEGAAGGFLPPASVAIVAVQVGTAIVQVAMAAALNVLKPVRVLRASLCLAALGAAVFGLGFEQLNLPNWGVFVVALLSGMGLGGLYSVYKVMVPEVVLWLQRDADASSGSLGSDLDTVSWDNMVYAWVDNAMLQPRRGLKQRHWQLVPSIQAST